MQYRISPEDVRFREEIREWLRANVPSDPLPPSGPGQAAYMRAWQRRQFDAGWAGISWPKEYGGRGLSLVQQVIWYEEYARANAPDVSCLFIGLNHGGPTLMVEGTPEQKAFHLPKILSGESIWCQGFSEPGAGSDLAGLRTRAQVDGAHLVVNGQKIWTSYANLADYQELLVRSDPEVSRYRGLTWVICDMKLPGVTVRPIEAIDGERHNCEVFYDNVRIPLGNVVGQINGGWKVALSTLSFERGTAFMEWQLRLAQTLERLIATANTMKDAEGRPLSADPAIAERLGKLRGDVAALRAMTWMTASRGLRQEVPGPEGTYVALMLSELRQAVGRLAMEILGPQALERPWTMDPDHWTHLYLRSFAATIAGGTAEVRRNIIGERVLGLPR